MSTGAELALSRRSDSMMAKIRLVVVRMKDDSWNGRDVGRGKHSPQRHA